MVYLDTYKVGPPSPPVMKWVNNPSRSRYIPHSQEKPRPVYINLALTVASPCTMDHSIGNALILPSGKQI